MIQHTLRLQVIRLVYATKYKKILYHPHFQIGTYLLIIQKQIMIYIFNMLDK